MTQELLQLMATLAAGLGGGYLGVRVAVARLETRTEHHHEEISAIKTKLDEHEGTLNSHSIQLAVLDTGNRRPPR